MLAVAPELDLAVHGVGLRPGEEATVEVAAADALVFVITGECSLEVPGRTVDLGAGDSADITMTGTLVLRTETDVKAVVIVGADRHRVNVRS